MKTVACYLNLEEQRLECAVDFADGWKSIGRAIDRRYEVSSLELTTPDTKLTCDRVPIAFASSVGGGKWSSDQTALRHTLGISPQLSYLTFVINEALVFDVSYDDYEIMFLPGYETLGRIEINASLSIVRGKDSISIIGTHENKLKDLVTSVSLAIGSPCRPCAQQIGKQLTLYLNNFGDKPKSRPLFFRGSPFIQNELSQAGIRDVFALGLRHIVSLPKQEAAGFRNSVMTFLQARSVATSFELQLYGAYYFLEWFDGSRTISANMLMKKLEISRKEADAIVKVRNQLSHNTADIADIITKETRNLYDDPSSSAHKYKSKNLSLSFLNFLFNVLGQALLTRIGYLGAADTYFPLAASFTPPQAATTQTPSLLSPPP